MRWQQKAAIQRTLSRLPGGGRLNDLLKLLGRRSWRLDEQGFLFHSRLAADHLAVSLEHLTRPASCLVAYEFGAGSSLVGPLTRRAHGLLSQVVVDRDALLRPSLVRDALRKIERHGSILGLSTLPRLPAGSRRRLIRDMKLALGIDYRAPVDARRTDLPPLSADLVISNSTLEHVPREDLEPLLAECRRLLKDDGVMCFRIDYEDHYAILDRGLSPYNFLRFSDREWRRYNSRLQFQNRLRHPDYLELFRLAALVVLRVETLEPSAEALERLARMPVAERFRAYSLADLGTRKGTFWLGKARRPCERES